MEFHDGPFDERHAGDTTKPQHPRHYPFTPIPLPYAYDALEPKIDALTMKLHHDRHYTTYVNNLNAALKDQPRFHNWTLEQLITHGKRLPTSIQTAVARNAGGVFNHEFFFDGLLGGTNTPHPKMTHSNEPFAGANLIRPPAMVQHFKHELKDKALSVFGSGYAWLCQDFRGEMRVITTANQDTPLTLGLQPILCIDVWEHAYYLKHYNNRSDYFDDWFSLV